MKRLVNINEFPGFYNSHLSAQIDSDLEQDVEYYTSLESLADDPLFPAELLRDENAMEKARDEACDHVDFRACHLKAAQGWLACLKEEIKEYCPFPLDMEYESIASPREYNFETDRLFVEIPYDQLRRMYIHVQKHCRSTFESIMRKRFTSRDGFISFYSNDIDEWTLKPLKEYDHNELGTVLSAYIEHYIDEDTFVYFELETGIGEHFNVDAWKEAVMASLV